MNGRVKSSTTEDTMLRNIGFRHERKLASMLDIYDCWERVAARIPKRPDQLFEPDEDFEPRYDTAHIHGFKSSRNGPTIGFLHDWGSKNVTIKHLLQLLRLTNNFAAVEYIQDKVLHQSPSKTSSFGACQHSDSSQYLSKGLNSSNTNTSLSGNPPVALSELDGAAYCVGGEMSFNNYHCDVRSSSHRQPVSQNGCQAEGSAKTSLPGLSSDTRLNAQSINAPTSTRLEQPIEASAASLQNKPNMSLSSTLDQQNPSSVSAQRLINSSQSSLNGLDISSLGAISLESDFSFSNGKNDFQTERKLDNGDALQGTDGMRSLPAQPAGLQAGLSANNAEASRGLSINNSGLTVGKGGAQDEVETTVEVYRSWAGVEREKSSTDQHQAEDNHTSVSKETVVQIPEQPDFPSCAAELQHLSYSCLDEITDNFNTEEAYKGGNLIGEGGFGYVFLGTFQSGQKAAVKSLKESTEDGWKQLLTEIKTLSTYSHENLVALLAYSIDGSRKCLIYEYMINGSLEDRLACRHNTPVLNTACRMGIVKGTAKGIEYLHSVNLIHRDIKSANILLDDNFTPKVGDFATARMLPCGVTTQTSKIICTPTYLAPEGINGNIHCGLDTYSFGVVLLEVLTGLPVLDPDRTPCDLLSYVEDHLDPDNDDDDEDEEGCDYGASLKQPGTIFDLVDCTAGEWEHTTVELLHEMSNRCLKSKKQRAKMANVVRWLDAGKIM